MIWLTWRQFRIQFLITIGVVAALIAYTLYVGYSVRSSYHSDVLGCVPADGCDLSGAERLFLEKQHGPVAVLSLLLYAAPAILGIFWGAPLVSRELEAKTHRLVWNQGVTRSRWLAFKLAIIALAGAAVAGVFSLALTWAASRYDQVDGDRFAPLSFASRNIVPAGYAVFALVLGATVGLIIRNTVAAMATALVLIGLLQMLAPMMARPYLRPPVTETVAFTVDAVRQHDGTVARGGDGFVALKGYQVPGALMVTSSARLLNEAGNAVTNSETQDCLTPGARAGGGTSPIVSCLAGRNLHFEVSYHPASRYWSFQWMELAGFLILTGLVSAIAFWRIRHVHG